MSEQHILQLSPLAKNWSPVQEAQCKSDFFHYGELLKSLPWGTAEQLRDLSIFFELGLVIRHFDGNDLYFATVLQFIAIPYFYNSAHATRSLVYSACVIRLSTPDYMPHLERLIVEYGMDALPYPCPYCGKSDLFISWGYYQCPHCEKSLDFLSTFDILNSHTDK